MKRLERNKRKGGFKSQTRLIDGFACMDRSFLTTQVDSFSVTSSGDAKDKGIGGSASIEVGLGVGMPFSGQKESKVSLPDLFFSAACGHALRPGSLDFRCKAMVASSLS